MKKEDENEDVNFEPEEELGDLGAAQAKLKKLKDALAHADRAAARIKENLIEDIIPVLDGFDMAAGSSAWASVDEQWRSGIDRIRNQLLDILGRHGVERFGKVGEIFDHAVHEAVEERMDVAGGSGTIAKGLRYGYKMKEGAL